MPVVGLLVGVAVASFDRVAARHIGAAWARVAAILAFVGIAGLYVERNAHYLFRMDETELIRGLYGDHPFLESPGIARYLSAHTAPDDRIAILGSEPQIYFYAHRKSATGDIYTYPLMEPQPYASRMQDEMRREVEAARPAYLVLVDLRASWSNSSGSDTRIVTWAADYAARCYDRVGIAEIDVNRGAELLWGADLANFQPGAKPLIITFRRRADGACSPA